MNAQLSTGFFASLVALRAALPGATVLAVAQDGDIGRAYRWDAASTRDDDGVSVLRPDTVLPGSPGRWLLFSNIALPRDATEGYIVEGIPFTPTNNRAAIAIRPGWEVLGIGDGPILWVGIRVQA